jgi:CRISPR-associated protein Cmr4
MKATGIPFVPGSSMKGVLRDVRRQRSGGQGEKIEAVFGPPTDRSDAHAGALVVGDARLLALPVRSFRGTFAWTTSPLLLTLAKRDLEGLAAQLSIPRFSGRGAQLATGSCCIHQGKKLYLEDLDLDAKESDPVSAWASLFAKLLSLDDDLFTKRFAVVDDETMTFLWETATQVDARVRLEPETRTVADGALWLEESLPPETLLIGLLGAEQSRRPGTPMKPDEVLGFALGAEEILQLGGKATTGRGRCRVIPLAQGEVSRGQA